MLYSVNGGRPQDNNYTLDGFDSNMQMMNSPGISPPMDALQEFKVATNTGSEFGRSMGANVSMVIKSGTNELHGTVYEYLRNNAFDANEFFANRNGLPQDAVPAQPVRRRGRRPDPEAVGTRCSGSSSWEGFRRRRGSTQITAACRPTDFRQRRLLAAADSRPTDHHSRIPSAGNVYANNIIPQAQINPAIPTALEPADARAEPPRLDVRTGLAHASQANNRDAPPLALGLQHQREEPVLLPLSASRTPICSSPNVQPELQRRQPVRRL